jgi:hypothetical protein
MRLSSTGRQFVSRLSKRGIEKKKVLCNFRCNDLFVTIGALIFFIFFSARRHKLIIDGSQQFQTIDGFGVNANALSWNDGELKPAIDMLADGMGSTLWRVVLDQGNWEAANDNSDPNSINWDYYKLFIPIEISEFVGNYWLPE